MGSAGADKLGAASLSLPHSVGPQLIPQQHQSSSLDPPQQLSVRRQKGAALNPHRKLDKYVRDLGTQNVTALAKYMNNKKYFHKFYQLQDLNRISLLTQDGKLNDAAFELINDNS